MTRRAPRTLSTITEAQTTRRQLLAMATVGSVGVAGVAAAGPAQAASSDKAKPGKHEYTLTVLGTTDLHGNVYNWDYYKNAEYDDSGHRDIGVAKAATLIKMVREEVGAGNTITLDAGDTIQGTPLAYYYAKIEPITGGTMHPMAQAMNSVGYDAAALGNHEFNYGLDLLRTFDAQCNHPLLSANTVDWNTGAPLFPPYVIKTVKVPGQKPLRVGILGLVTPGVAIWDKANVQGKAKFPGIVEQAKIYVPASRPPAPMSSSCPATPARPRRRPTATPCRTPRTPAACSPSRSRTSTPSSSGTPTSTSTSSSPIPRRARRFSWSSRSTGVCGSPAWTSRWPRSRASGSSTTPRSPAGSTTPTPCPRMPRSPGSSGRRTRRCSPTSTA